MRRTIKAVAVALTAFAVLSGASIVHALTNQASNKDGNVRVVRSDDQFYAGTNSWTDVPGTTMQVDFAKDKLDDDGWEFHQVVAFSLVALRLPARDGPAVHPIHMRTGSGGSVGDYRAPLFIA